MSICPIGTMYNGIIHVEIAAQTGAVVRPQAVVYKLEINDKKADYRSHRLLI